MMHEQSAAALKAWAAGRLAQAGVEAPEREAVLLLAHAAGRSTTWAWAAGPEDTLAAECMACYKHFVEERAKRLPFAYVVGSVEFRDLRLKVGPGVLVPRPETEHLLDTALALVAEAAAPPAAAGAGVSRPEPRLLDLGTGSGALAIALASALPAARVWATDISVRALAIAAANALRAGVHSRIRFLRGDWWSALDGAVYGDARDERAFDGVVCNPPYLSQAERLAAAPELAAEPEAALVSGPSGYEAFAKIIAGAPQHLRQGSFLAFEVGAGQATEVRRRLATAGFHDIRMTRDLAGYQRVVAGRWG